MSKVKVPVTINTMFASKLIPHDKGVGMMRAEIGLKNRQIINETYSFRFFLI